MPYRIAPHTEASVVCVVHMFRDKYFSVLFFVWGRRGGGTFVCSQPVTLPWRPEMWANLLILSQWWWWWWGG